MLRITEIIRYPFHAKMFIAHRKVKVLAKEWSGDSAVTSSFILNAANAIWQIRYSDAQKSKEWYSICQMALAALRMKDEVTALSPDHSFDICALSGGSHCV
jgi:hypothetical protein